MFNKRRKIRNYWLIPSYQGRYVGFLVGSCLVAMVGYGLVFYKFIKENYDTIVELSPMSDDSQTLLYSELNTIIYYLVGLSFVFLLAVAIIGIVFSHKVAGPMFKISHVCSDINSGKLGRRIELRPGDDFREVVSGLNKAFNTLHIAKTVNFKVVHGEAHLHDVFAIESLVAMIDEGKMKPDSLVVALDDPQQIPRHIHSVVSDYRSLHPEV